MRANIAAKTAVGFLFTALSLLANPVSYAGYVQANSNQDFALLSASIGDNAFKVTFSSGGSVDFSYFSGSTQQNATLNLVDTQNFASHVPVVGALAGAFAINNPAQPSILGTFFVLPPADYNFTNVGQQSLSAIVPGDSVVRISSLIPVVVHPGGCPYCGLVPYYGDGYWPSDFNSFDVPEPSTVALFGCGLLAVALFQWRRVNTSGRSHN